MVLVRDNFVAGSGQVDLHLVGGQSSGLVGEDVFDLAQLLQCSKMFFSKTETWSQLRTRRVLM